MEQDNVDYFFSKFGEPTQQRMPTSEEVGAYKGKLPDALISFWEKYGFCGFMDGLYWVVNPADYVDTLNLWLGDTGILEKDNFHVITRSAFGDLFLWGEKTGSSYKINSKMGWILPRQSVGKEIARGFADRMISSFLCFSQVDEMDSCDDDRKKLFDRAVNKLGALDESEVFAFEPTLIVSNKARLEDIVKMDIFKYLLTLAQPGERKIMGPDNLAKASI